MRRLTLGLPAALIVALACGAAWADRGHRGHGQHGRYGHSGGSSYYQQRSYGGGGWNGYGGYRDAFSDAAREVREAHSRYGFNTHPRSYYNAPDARYYYWGW